MAKVLLVDTNFSSGPIHSELLAMGHEVHVVGNNPRDCLAKVSDHYWQQDYSDLDALDSLIQAQGFDFLVPGCTDRSYLSCAEVGRGRFPGFDDREARHAVYDKQGFREAAERFSLPSPGLLDPSMHDLDTPVIVKPVDAFSGRGVTVLRQPDDASLHAAIASARRASTSGRYLIERFVEGQLYSHSAFIRRGKVWHDVVVREDGSANPFVVDTSHVVPQVDDGLLDALRRCTETVVACLGLVDGLLHTQFIWDSREFWLIELTRRCPGDLYSQLIELSTGFPYARTYALPYLDELFPDTLRELACRPVMRHTVSLDQGCDLAYLKFKRPVQIERWVPLALVGDHIQPSPSGRIGILFSLASDHRDLESLYRRALDRDLYTVQGR
ncbi:MAG: ATP-grasp domain-containing protein [Dyella sp.]|uniref:ATP-grasp domain-containing protein n=1 Tax=Dyella sp. TaxID=1869338 RepID=UPI003F7D6DEA